MYKEFDMRGVGRKSALSKVGFGATVPDKYRWTQTMNFVDLYVALPKGVTQAKQLNVAYTRDTLRVAVKGAPEPIVDGKLYAALRVDDCNWTIVEADGVHEALYYEGDDPALVGKNARRHVLHMELAKYDNDQITREIRRSFWRALMLDGPTIPNMPANIPPDYYDTHLDDRDAGRLWGDGAREYRSGFK